VKAILQKIMGPAEIATERLGLVTITPKMLMAEKRGANSLARAVPAKVTAEWPPANWDPQVQDFILKQFLQFPKTLGWHRYMLLPDPAGKSKSRTMVGACGAFPRERGDVEMGYSTLPAYQRNGYATEAVRALTDWLLSRDGVSSVSAQTYARVPESVKVMERCGMMYAGLGDEPGTVRYRRSR
jgi:ribosomal-protein-alanine N-acetyltransferase